MKKILFIIIFTVACCIVKAQNYNVDFTIKPSTQLTMKMQANLNKLFSELNRAFAERQAPNLSGIAMSDDAKNDVQQIWANSRIRTVHQTEVFTEMTLPHGMGASVKQIRNIPVYMFPIDGSEKSKQEIFCDFDSNGQITSFQICIEQNRYKDIFTVGMDVPDLERRTIILHFVEMYRTAYEKKDILFLSRIHSQDALIIVGNVRYTKTDDGRIIKDTVRTVNTRDQYIQKLRNVFATSNRIIVTYDDIVIKQHPNPRFSQWYGVNLIQHWNSGSYKDDGNLFLLWDFTDPDHPMIHVRAWDDVRTGHKFSIDDFNIGE